MALKTIYVCDFCAAETEIENIFYKTAINIQVKIRK